MVKRTHNEAASAGAADAEASTGESGAGAADASTGSVEEGVVWGRSYGFGGLPSMPADEVIDAAAAAAEAQAAQAAVAGGADGDAALGSGVGVGPVWEAVGVVREALAVISEGIDGLAVAELAPLAQAVHEVATLVGSVHVAAVGAVRRHGAVPPGSVTATDWLATSHRLTGGRARALTAAAGWLETHPRTADAFHAGGFSVDHLCALRATVEANAARRAAFAEFEPHLLAVAGHTNIARVPPNPARLG